ncbi:MAG: glucosaminidase domain-containing protein [Flavobacteriales bacterium]|nr:glucosaminidase domain-containing protein [Flavobacteriales bacterium]MCB9446889.1 glucosaminidase domain-containing protein [Flavobacteriales bacterium]
MKKQAFISLCLVWILGARVMAEGQPLTASDYITRYKDMAITNMIEMGVPASITLAQGMLESGNGNSRLAMEGNNHFGIKCHSDWDGPTIHEDDDQKHECFRKYRSVLDSYHDHAAFLRGKQRYAFLFDLSVTDYKGWAKGLKQAGYATNPQYAARLIHIIEENGLQQYDEVAIAQGLKTPPVLAKETKQAKETSKTRKENRSRKHKISNEGGSEIISEVELGSRRQLSYVNNTPFIVARKGDTFYRIASDMDMEIWQLIRYNDLPKDHVLAEGERVYIKPKRRKATQETYAVKEGESLHDISQQFGVKEKHLLKYNDIRAGEVLTTGQLIHLKKPRK